MRTPIDQLFYQILDEVNIDKEKLYGSTYEDVIVKITTALNTKNKLLEDKLAYSSEMLTKTLDNYLTTCQCEEEEDYRCVRCDILHFLDEQHEKGDLK